MVGIPRGTSIAFGREVLAGFFTLSFAQVRVITLTWTVHGAAKKAGHRWHYQELIQRQAGVQWTLHLRIMLPSCATVNSKSGGVVSSSKQVATLTQSLSEDLHVGLDYTC